MARVPADDPTLRSLRLLHEALERLDVVVRTEPLPDEAHLSGGLCRVRGRAEVVVSPHASLAEQLEVLLGALRELETDTVWLPPAVRQLLEAED